MSVMPETQGDLQRSWELIYLALTQNGTSIQNGLSLALSYNTLATMRGKATSHEPVGKSYFLPMPRFLPL